MSPDKFNDRIRQKLESVDPPFREKDWSSLQRVLHQHGMTSAWFTPRPWMMPAASMLATAAMLVVAFGLYRSNQQLQHDVQTLSRTVARIEKKTNETTTKRPDTVYVTRYVPVNAPTAPTNMDPTYSPDEAIAVAPTQLAKTPNLPRTNAQPRQIDQPDNPILVEQQRPVSVPTSPLPTVPTETAEYDKSSTLTTTQPVESSNRTATNLPVKPATGSERANLPTTRQPSEQVVSRDLSANQPTIGRNRTGSVAATSRRTGSGYSSGNTQANQTYPGQVSQGQYMGTQTAEPVAIESVRANSPVIDLTPLPNTTLRFDPETYTANRDKALRRMRRWVAVNNDNSIHDNNTVIAQAASPAASTVNVRRFRLGLGGEVGVGQWSAGLYSELLLGKHITMGLGLNRLQESCGQFLTDIQFNEQTKQNFRREYARGIDPQLDIFDINRRNIIWQLPISVGYRVMLGKGFAVTPSIATTLTWQVTEQTDFTFRRSPREFSPVHSDFNRLPANYNSWSLASMAEKGWKHWVAQAGPYINVPYSPQLGGYALTGGVRARVLYQF